MKIKLQKALKAKKGILVIPVFKDQLKKTPDYPKKLKTFIKDRIKIGGFNADPGKTITTFFADSGLPSKLMLIGFGEESNYTPKVARELGAKLVKAVQAQNEKEVTLACEGPMDDHLEELLEGALMVQYHFETLKSEKKNQAKRLERFNLVVQSKAKHLQVAIDKAINVATGVELVQELVNHPSNIVDANYMVKEAKRIAKENKYKIAVLREKDLKKMAWGGILAVNQGSDNEAQCVVLEYQGAKKKNDPPIVIVGKGVIFDTGGYNIKLTRYIEKMHQDMAGAATILGLFEILKDCGIEQNVVGIMPMAENLISAKAYRPSDIITMYSGNTVEITNTDAEGRLLLADGLHYGTQFNPQCLISIATLTGAVAIATGIRYAGLMGNNYELREALRQAGDEVDDYGWPLPIHDDYRKRLDSEIADFRNADTADRSAGSSKAACFLEKFVQDNDWCHIDIGGTAFTSKPKPYQQPGATGHGLRMLLRFLENQSL